MADDAAAATAPAPDAQPTQPAAAPAQPQPKGPRTFAITVDGLPHKIQGDHPPTPDESQAIIAHLRATDPYSVAEQANGLPPGMLRAIARHESQFNPAAEGKNKAGVVQGRGIMQFTHDTGVRYGLDPADFTNPTKQIHAAGKFMADNLRATGGDVRRALARYGPADQSDYADKVMAGWSQATEPGSPQGPPPRRSAYQMLVAGEDITASPGILGEAYYELIGRPAADLNALAVGATGGRVGTDPAEFKRERIAAGAPGAARLRDTPVDVGRAAKGILNFSSPSAIAASADAIIDTFSAVGAPLQVKLFTTPLGALFGLAGVGLRRLYHNDIIADRVEAGGALGLGIVEGLRGRAASIARPRVQEFRDLGVAEQSALGAAHAAESQAAGHQEFHDALVTRVGQAQDAAANAEVAAVLRTQQAREAHETAVATAKDREAALTVPQSEVKGLLKLSEDVPARGMRSQAGETLKRETFAAEASLAKRVYSAFDARDRAFDAAGVQLQPDDSLLAVHEAAHRWKMRTLDDPRVTAAERQLGDDIESLGLDHYVVKGTDQRLGIDEAKAAVEAKQLNWAMLDPQYTPVKASVLSKLHARVANMALTPEQYAASTNFARREFDRLRFTLGDTLKALETADPDASRLGSEARRLVREEQKPFIFQVARKVLRPGATPSEAFGVLTNTKDAERLRRAMVNGRGDAPRAYADAWLANFLEDHTANGDVGIRKLVTDWSKVNPEIQDLLVSHSSLKAKEAFDTMRAQVRGAESAAEAVPAAKKALGAAKTAEKVTTVRARQLRSAGKTAIAQAKADVTAAIKAVQRAASQAEHLNMQRTRLGNLPERENVLAFGRNRNNTWGFMIGGIGVAQLTGGTARGAFIGAAHVMMSYMILAKPRLVAEAAITPLHTVRGQQLALALRLLMQGWRGTVPIQQGPAGPNRPPASPPSTAPPAAPVGGSRVASTPTRPQ